MYCSVSLPREGSVPLLPKRLSPGAALASAGSGELCLAGVVAVLSAAHWNRMMPPREPAPLQLSPYFCLWFPGGKNEGHLAALLPVALRPGVGEGLGIAWAGSMD